VRTVLALLVIAACSKDGGGGSGSAAPAAAGSAAAKKGGGFSASLSADLAKEDTGSGSAAGSAAPAGSAVAAAPAAGSAVALAKPADTKAAPPPADTKAAPPPADTKAAPPPPDTKVAAAPVQKPGARTHVAPPADIAAIKLDLEPNWDRDLGEAATISFVLNTPSGEQRLFSFHYGYDAATAPADRDLYKKYLADQKILNVTLDRQRGAAWYLEGTDGNGAGAFRYRVTYGGKQLVCWGSLYKDAASNPLGDLRDKVVMAAKKICETMSL
jgi:hypothetical protein